MRTSFLPSLVLGSLLVLGCSAPHATPSGASDGAPASPPPSSSADLASPAPSASSSTALPATSADVAEKTPPRTPSPRVAEVAVIPFEHTRSTPATSLALGKRGFAAVLDTDPWIYDGKAWKAYPLPDKLTPPAGARDDVQIFFGRDNRIRLMGRRTQGDDVGFVYVRYRNGWILGHREIGALANKPHDALFGILGWDDPEVVCKVGDICIIKRLTGWTVIKSGPGAPVVVVAQESAWALHDDHIAEVTNKGWKKMDPIAFTKPRGLWADADKKLWVSAGTSMHHFDGKGWKAHKSPVATPRAVWGSSPTDVWVAGEDGAGHFDGKSWRKVKGVKGPLTHTLGRDGVVWFAGPSGVWRGKLGGG